jgi:hypothetical protein
MGRISEFQGGNVMAKRRQWDFKKLVAIMRRSFDNPEVLAETAAHKKKLAEKGKWISDLVSSLGILATLDGRAATAWIADCHPGGWARMRRCFLRKAWGIRILIGLQDKGKYYGIGAQEELLTLTLAHAMATQEDAYAEFLGNRVLKSITARDGKFTGWDMAPFEPFIMKLFGLWKGVDLKFDGVKVCPQGVYQEILDAWHDETALAKAMTAACDYHCLRSFNDPNGFPEFAWEPYNVFPVDILAIQRVRRDLGLKTPTIEHPLLDTPLTKIPATPPAVEDEVLATVRQRALEELPGIGDPW